MTAFSARAFGAALDPGREAALRRLERLAWLLDSAVLVPGTRFRIGLDSLVGLVPGVGDAVGLALALYPILEAHRLGAPGALKARMLANVLLDAGIGAVPLAGDLFDMAFRANARNVALLRRHLHGLPA